MTTPTPPRWMRNVLLAAGLYNVLWGAFAVLFPAALFTWLDMPQPNYPQFWQCIGMIVGVYGLGYAIAATNPARHWPIVLVGFLGKVFGPLGMAQALWTGALPWPFALNCLTNDLIWWIPFFLILRYAWHQFQQEPANSQPPDEATLLSNAITSTGTTLAALSQSHPVLLVLLRHSGCTFCREAMADLSTARTTIARNGTTLALVHMGTADSFASFAARYGMQNVPAISDPDRQLYQGLGLRRGNPRQLLALSVWCRGLTSFLSGHRPGPIQGDATQMPGVFLIHQSRVVRRFSHTTAAVRPDYAALAQLPSPA